MADRWCTEDKRCMEHRECLYDKELAENRGFWRTGVVWRTKGVWRAVFLRDPGLDLRVEHSHGWGEGGQVGLFVT